MAAEHPNAAATAGPRELTLVRQGEHWTARFVAMVCPCEVLIEIVPEATARRIADAAAAGAWRVEAKFSRYRSNNIVDTINNANGSAVCVDDETANLLDLAATLTRLSGGRFDITSGVLRRVWAFDGGDRIPAQQQIDALRHLIGWEKVSWQRPMLRLLPDMQIDFGGIGKEYAVDLAVQDAHRIAPGASCLVNFGGDVAIRNPRRDGKPWRIGVESSHAGMASRILSVYRGGVATSGDSRRYVLKDGIRYSHVLDARTGWPVESAPSSVTVLADTCTQAGSFTTLAMLEGPGAEDFLKGEGVAYWLQ
ncbi:MAG: FAD:protein FMN transferase [Steroidobacteraceae bacterium]